MTERVGDARDADGDGGDGPPSSIRGGSPRVLLETVAARVPEPVVVLDREGTVVTVNDRFESLCGVASEDVNQRPVTALFPDVDLAAVEDNCTAAAGTYLTSRCRAPEERWVELSFEGHRRDEETYFIGVAHDVTERRAREQDLEQYERILETIEDGIYTLDESFTIETVNSAIESMTGHAEADLVGSSATLLADESTIDRAARMSRELRTGERDIGTLTTTIETADGEDLPIETRFTTYDYGDDDGFRQVGVVRDISDQREFERTLASLHEATRQLLHAETKADVAEQVADTAQDVLGLSGAAVYHFDRQENALRPTATADPPGTDRERTPIPPGGGQLWEAFVGSEPVEVGPGEDVDLGVHTEDGEGSVCHPLDEYGVFHVVTDAEDRDGRTRELVDLLAASAQAALARVDREAALREREAESRERNRELRQLQQVNAIIRRVHQALVDAETRDEVEEAVCDELVGSSWFEFAWIGRREGTDVVPRAWAGASSSYLDAVSRSTTGDGGPPAVQTARSESLTVVPSVAEGLRRDQWRSEALSRDFQSAIGVPLRYDGVLYGVLSVYADRGSVFGEMLQSVFAELGNTIAHAMHEVASRRRRSRDSVAELDLTLSALGSPARLLAERLETPVVCEGVVPRGEETRLFLRIDDCDPERASGASEEMARIDSLSQVSAEGDGGLFEAVVTGPTVGETLLDHGARLQSIRASPDGVDVTVHVSGDTHVREFVDQLRGRYPDAQLVARREESDPGRTLGGTRSAIDAALTERQLEVLRTAYLSGYFAWPRETSGQDLAEMLEVAQPTVNRHLRVGQRKVLDVVLAGG